MEGYIYFDGGVKKCMRGMESREWGTWSLGNTLIAEAETEQMILQKHWRDLLMGDPCLGLPTAGKNVKAGTIAERRSVVPFPTAGKNAKAGKIVGKM